MVLVSIIIPVHPSHNQDNILGACLRSIRNQTYPQDEIELILVGDGCNITHDLSSQGIKRTIYNFKSHVGVCKARNKAIQLSEGELLAFIDADCIADTRWLEFLVSGFKNDDIGGCGGGILDLKNRWVNKKMLYDTVYILPCTDLCNAIFRRGVLQEIGFLDEQLSRGEDVDLSWRVYLKGYRIEYVPAAVVVHRGISNLKDFFLHGIGVMILANKYKKIFNSSPYVQIRRSFNSMKYALKADFSTSEIIKYLSIISGYIYGLLKEKLRLSPRLKQVDLTDKFLQPTTSIKPLAVTLDSQALIKPNYIIWWKSENGCRILDLRTQRKYELEDISAHIWESIMARKPKNVIVEQLIDEYEVGEIELKKDLAEFIEYLYKEKILILF